MLTQDFKKYNFEDILTFFEENLMNLKKSYLPKDESFFHEYFKNRNQEADKIQSDEKPIKNHQEIK